MTSTFERKILRFAPLLLTPDCIIACSFRDRDSETNLLRGLETGVHYNRSDATGKDALAGDLAEVAQAEGLESAGVCENGAISSHEPVTLPSCRISAGPGRRKR